MFSEQQFGKLSSKTEYFLHHPIQSQSLPLTFQVPYHENQEACKNKRISEIIEYRQVI